jgi:hypothetical protein
MRRLLLVSLALAATSACTYTASENVRTSGIYAYFSIVDLGDDTVDIQSRFSVGGPTGTVVYFSGGDHLEVNGQPIDGLGADFPRSDDRVYDLTLVRDDETVTTMLEAPAMPEILSMTPEASLDDAIR